MTPQESLDLITATLFTIVNLPWAIPLANFVIGLIKGLVSEKQLSARTLSLTVYVTIWVGFTIASHFNRGGDYKSFFEVLETVLPPIVGFIGTLLGGTALYKLERRVQVPLLGTPQKFS